ncbi:GGDEF domain-containing protein [Sphingopyxis yananensis]|uniref:GGDEF domain-containing protein n=1 Tax=Sphingopyxis yananensis TaxID=2886687 RepID=UPI001D1164B9|nr:GGDEF domain-containing protein [Sphingopyxis yananensis]MCC2601548.1 GGDEF domain-containing protein [Sphingopyxis yananensis]
MGGVTLDMERRAGGEQNAAPAAAIPMSQQEAGAPNDILMMQEPAILDEAALGEAGVLQELAALRQLCSQLQQENGALRAAMVELERVAQRDTLTPLYNRRHFLSCIKKQLVKLQPHEERGAVVFMDMNQLKAINDRYGHAAGDFALVEVAARVEAQLGTGDMAARIGGDEFGLLLASADREDARARVRCIEAALADLPAMFEGQAIGLSACYGVAMLRGGESGVSILAEADRDMYVSKHIARAHQRP